MATIEERAYDYALEEAQVEGFDFGSVKDGYIKGATDQRQISIIKACNAYCKAQCGKVTAGCQECGKYKVFRKAMEE